MSSLEPVLGGDDTIRRNFSKLEDLYTQLDAANTRITNTQAAAGAVAGGRAFLGIAAATGAGTYHMSNGGGLIASGASWVALAAPEGLVPLRAADYAITGTTTQLRVVAITMTNGTDDTRTITHGLYPYTISGAAGLQALTLGTVVAGSTIAVDPTTNEERIDDSGWFTFPADGPYCLGAVLSGAGAANSIRAAEVVLQIRHT